ncbi:NACHT, LRR and PYD domains-containing 12-like isoform X1 [Paramuricea clavata]|uniref:NACHT, LRR and PYD domains-containing 12-like isoform X1 n=1 Tax=Paramuricea clavata TaxID=317549 RepID=A0A6S7IG42_PARCT|nr:NACHT, LRR and PYD domains-containing 12-like isoform X1 [Paramuricea clavata]
MKKLANLTLLGFAADCFPEVLGLLRKRCLSKLEIESVPHDQVFSALMELNCTLDHKHTKLTSLTVKVSLQLHLPIMPMRNFIENGHASQLEQLTLTRNGIDSHQISKLCEIFNKGHCPNLTHLDLGNNPIRDEGVMVVCDTLTKGLRKLNRLAVCVCGLTDRCIPTLVKALQDEHCELTNLSLGFNAIGDKGVDMLFEDAFTKEHCKLTNLNLYKCSLTDQCIPSLYKALQNERCQLTVLFLGNNAIYDKGVGKLFEDALTKEQCKLTELALVQCSLTDQCIPCLCKALQDERCKLTQLWLRSNNFTENGKKLLCDIKDYESCKAMGLEIL